MHAIHHIPSPFVRQQIDLSLADIGADVIKTGMLASAATVQTVAAALAERPDIPLVLDPVMVSTSGAALLPPEALRVLREELLGRATVVTPNLPEARLLLADAGVGFLGCGSVEEVVEMAWAVRGLAKGGEGRTWVLLKGGHCPRRRDGREARREGEREVVVDVLVGPGGEVWRFETPWWEGTSTHGTGCSLACELWMGGGGGVFADIWDSCDCVEYGQGDGGSGGGTGGVSVCRGGHQDGAGVGEGEWAAESLSLDVYPAVCAVGCPLFLSSVVWIRC